MFNKLRTVAFGAAMLAVAAPAMAQDTMLRPVGLSIRAGVFVPTDTNTRRGNSGWFAGGVEYKLRDMMMGQGRPTQLTLSLDYMANNNFRNVPLLLNLRRHSGPIFYSGGVGVAFTRRPTGGGSDDRTRFAFQVGIGYEFTMSENPLFVEGKFFGSDRSDLNGFGMYVGVRF